MDSKKGGGNNRPKKSIKDYERDGVYYTPSETKVFEDLSLKPLEKTQVRQKRPEQRRVKPQKSQLAVFYVVTIIFGVIISITVFSIVFNKFLSKDSGAKNIVQTETPIKTEVAIEDEIELTELTTLILETSSETSQIKVLDIETSKQYNLYADVTTKISDKYGQMLVFAELKAGDIMDVKFDARNGNLTAVYESTAAWEFKNVKNVRVDIAKSAITIGNDVYGYDSNLISVFRGGNYNISQLSPMDYVTVRGLKNKLLFIELANGHGTLEVVNGDKIKDGTIEVDTTVFRALDEAKKIELLEGSHKIVIKGANIDPFITEVTVSLGETSTVDLSEIQLKRGVITIDVDVEGATIYIDGTKTELTGQIPLDYGEYTIKVEKEGYEPYEAKAVVAQNPAVVTAKLQKIVEDTLLMGRLLISTAPVNADVFIDNAYVGVAPLTIPLQYGVHVVTLKAEGYKEYPMAIEITDTEHSYLFNLQPIDSE